jgi:hypothetical protein
MMGITCVVLACIAPLLGLLIASSELINYFTKRINMTFFANIVNGIASTNYVPLLNLLSLFFVLLVVQ